MNRRVLVAAVVAAMLTTAGCSTGLVPGDGGAEGDERSVTFYISDRPNAIEEFERLEVTVMKVGVHRTDDPDTSANESGWTEKHIDGLTVDLTQLTGQKAVRLAQISLEKGTYDKVFIHVSDVEGELESGEEADVKLPSERLQIKREFIVGESVGSTYTFDVGVTKAGGSGKYVIKPVVSESGADVVVEENPAAKKGVSGGAPTDERTDRAATPTPTPVPATFTPTATPESTATPDSTETPESTATPDTTTDATPTSTAVQTDTSESSGGKLGIDVAGDVVAGREVSVQVTRNGNSVTGATVRVNGRVAGETDGDGTIVVTVPEGAETLKLTATLGDASGERTYPVDEGDGGQTATPTSTPTPTATPTATPTQTATSTATPNGTATDSASLAAPPL